MSSREAILMAVCLTSLAACGDGIGYSNQGQAPPESPPAPMEDPTGPPEEVCLTFQTDLVDFGHVFVDLEGLTEVEVVNCGERDTIEIDTITLDSEVFYLTSRPALSPLAPGAALTLQLGFSPSTNGSFEALLLANAAGVEAQTALVGRGGETPCPVAVAKASEVGVETPPGTSISTIPLTTLQFDGTSSDDFVEGPGAASYEWTIIERPTDSTTRFTPTRNAPDPLLFLDLAGRYVVELTVANPLGDTSCNTARIDILATPDEDIHVQLVWNTPGDPDQTDSGTGQGSDIDLHFLHPAGTWNEPPWDVFWRNIEPNWGDSDASNDDPSLDIDDTDGAGPENVNLDNPEDATYSVGVYYFSAHNFGPSFATLRIYIHGELAFEQRDRFMEKTGDFWHVADIQWGQDRNIYHIDRGYESFP